MTNATKTNLFGNICLLKSGEVLRAANSVDWDYAQEHGEAETGAFVDYETGETVFCDGPSEMSADMARAAFIERFDTSADAISFEETVLGAGREFIPEELRGEIGESEAYWAWLTDQHAAWQHKPVTLTAEQHAAITTGKTVLNEVQEDPEVAAARTAYVALFSDLAAAVAFEDRALSIGGGLLPDCARAVRDDSGAATVEYYTWLSGQVEQAGEVFNAAE